MKLAPGWEREPGAKGGKKREKCVGRCEAALGRSIERAGVVCAVVAGASLLHFSFPVVVEKAKAMPGTLDDRSRDGMEA